MLGKKQDTLQSQNQKNISVILDLFLTTHSFITRALLLRSQVVKSLLLELKINWLILLKILARQSSRRQAHKYGGAAAA